MDPRATPVVDGPAPITEHLGELRSRILKSLAAWLLGFALAWGFKEQIFGFLLAPAVDALGPDQPKLQAIAPTEIFFTYVKCGLLAGFVFALPVIFWQLWSFIAPGLYSSEKKMLLPFVACSTLLFGGGSLFGYTVVFPIMYAFFTSFDSEFVISAWTMREVFSLTSRMFLVFGVAFELPLLIFFLSIAGIVDAGQLARATPYAVLGVFVTAAVLTPPDPVSQVFLAVPLLGLYLLGVGAAWLSEGRTRSRKSGASTDEATGSGA